MRAAAEDLDLRQRHSVASAPPRYRQRHAVRRRGGVGRGHRDREGRVAAEARLVRRAVERDQARVDRAWSSAAQAGDRARDPPSTWPSACMHVEAAERCAAVAQVERFAAFPASAGGRDGAAGAPPASTTSASTVGRPRVSQTRRAWTLGSRESASTLSDRSRAHRAAVPRARRGDVAEAATGRRSSAPATRRTRSRSARRRCIRPATCRRRGRASAPAAAPPRAARRLARLPVDGARYAPPARERGQEAAVAAGVHRHFRSRWLRQKARSNAGSPHHAHSASSKTGPAGPIRMFLGLTSPWTSARLVAAVVATSAPAPPRARDGAAPSRAGRARAGSRRRSRRCRSGRRARAAPPSRRGCGRAWRRPRAAVAGSAPPSRSIYFQSGCPSGAS